MDVGEDGLPPNTEFSVFVLTSSDWAFWDGFLEYQGDIVTDKGSGQSGVSWDFQQRAFCLRPCVPRRP